MRLKPHLGLSVAPATAACTAVALLLTACGPLRDATRAHVETAARAAGRDLAVEQLAGWFAVSRSLPVRPDVVERVAHMWVDFVLLAARVAEGDSLTDSTRVLAARWPDVRRLVVGRFHDGLVAQRVRLDSAQLDSTFAAGTWRYVRHVLLRVTPGLSPDQVAAKQRQAEAIRARLVAGGSWSQANAANEDSVARRQGGELGVLARGDAPGPFEEVVFRLEPGELGPVTATPLGYHVIGRPRLSEVRSGFRTGVTQRLVAQLDSAFVSEVEQRRGLAVRSNASGLVQRAAASPLLFRMTDQTVAGFAGGRLTAGDVLRWLEVLPPDMADRIAAAPSQDVRRLVESIAREAMLFAEATEAGVRLTPEEYASLRDAVAGEVATVRSALELDSADVGGSADPVKAKVDAYFNVIINNLERLEPVPRFLADQLRSEAEARVYPAGVSRAYALAGARRAAVDSAAGRVPGVQR